VFGERGGEVLGVVGLERDVAVAVGVALVGDDGGALTAGGGAVAAAFVGVHRGVVRGDHGLGFSPGAGFLLGGVYPPVLQKTCWKLLETKKTGAGAGAKNSKRARDASVRDWLERGGTDVTDGGQMDAVWTHGCRRKCAGGCPLVMAYFTDWVLDLYCTKG
jgi:hypothetical protein